MLQRIQTVYLTLALILLIVSCSCNMAVFEPEGMGGATYMSMLCLYDQEHVINYLPVTLLVLISLAVILTVLSIFGYKNHKSQIKKCSFTIIVELLWVINYGVYALTLVNDAQFRPGWGASLPIIAIVLTFLGRKGVKADRKLLHDTERIR